MTYSSAHSLLGNECFQHTGIGVLWIAEIKNFVKKFVDEYEIVLDVFLVQLSEVRLHHEHEIVLDVFLV
uniref:Uncharacterized protein n=1 Tax=Steinernema glaseri TaxID=37863 RepID=A0A1I7Z1N7_9BILA